MSWFKLAEQEKQPYDIYLMLHGTSRKLNNGNFIWAFSESQAVLLAERKYENYLRDYAEAGFGIRAVLNKEENKRVKDAKIAEEQRKERKKKEISNMWWNKD